MRHDIVADFLFPLTNAVIIDILDMGGQFVHLRLCYRQAEFHFRFRQGNPEASPGAVAGVGREQLQHILRSIPGGQWGFILLCHRFSPFCIMSSVNLSQLTINSEL